MQFTELRNKHRVGCVASNVEERFENDAPWEALTPVSSLDLMRLTENSALKAGVVLRSSLDGPATEVDEEPEGLPIDERDLERDDHRLTRRDFLDTRLE